MVGHLYFGQSFLFAPEQRQQQGAQSQMPIDVESKTSDESPTRLDPPSAWMKLGLVAMASAVLGGMATAWWYRKTLIRMRQAEETDPNPQFGIFDDDSGDEI